MYCVSKQGWYWLWKNQKTTEYAICNRVLYYWIKKIRIANQINPLTPMGDLDRISLYNNYQHNIKQTSNEKKEKSSSGDYWLIQYQILQTNITRTIWQTVRRITNEILGVKGLKENIRSSWCEFTVKSSKLPQDQLQLVLVLNLIGWESWLSVLNQSQQREIEICSMKLESGTFWLNSFWNQLNWRLIILKKSCGKSLDFEEQRSTNPT